MSELSDYLSENLSGLTIKSTHIALRLGKKKEDWDHDEWEITVSYNGGEYTTQYKTGLGHRKCIKNTKQDYIRGVAYYSTPKGNMPLKEACKGNYLQPMLPSIADVISSLLLDSSSADETFEDWCGNFGYDTDSRKALATYMKCQETRSAMLKFFGCELFNTLSQLEH